MMMRRLLQNCRALVSAAPSSWAPTCAPRHMLHTSSHRPSILLTNATDEHSRSASKVIENAALLLAFGCGLSFAVSGLVEPARSEADFVDNKVGECPKEKTPECPEEKTLDTESIMQQAEKRIQERLKTLNLSASALSPFTVSAKGQQVSIKFPVSPLCDLWHLMVNVIAHVGKLNNDINHGKIIVSASDSVVAQFMVLEHPDYQIQKQFAEKSGKETASSSNALCIGIFEPLIGEKFPEIEFLKKGHYTEEELDLVVNTLRISSVENPRKSPRKSYKKQYESRQKDGNNKSALDTLEAMGVKVYGHESLTGQADQEVVSWENIAGYHEQKREIEDTVLLALRCPEIYDSIARGTRRKFESNRPRAVLFEGPPGTGKTSSARVIANQAGVPLLYVPLEAVMSKYYGESEGMLGKVFNTANGLQNGAIIFLDEIDSLATTRDSEMHEATRRILSVLLRQIDGFEQDNRVVVIAATNRKEDLDPALISRFDSSITFDLPDQQTREEITAQYACHLTPTELTAVAVASEGMSGRDLRDICQQAERRWASKVIRNHASSPMAYGLPPLEEYIVCARKRRNALQALPSVHNRRGRHGKWPPSVVV